MRDMLKDNRGEEQGCFHKGTIYMIYVASEILLYLLIPLFIVFIMYICILFSSFLEGGTVFSCLSCSRNSTN